VTVFRGTVQLSGFVDMKEQKTKAEGIAKGVEGVRNVVDNITISNPAGRSAGQAVDDKDLEHRVQDALSNSPEYKFDEVEVNVSQGVVQLSGFVNTSDQKSKASDTAKGVAGVNEVNNNITVKDKM
jgi:hyperosmotically inducible periplasmic protein